jgi:polar amino acid transport system substrate-binding protein
MLRSIRRYFRSAVEVRLPGGWAATETKNSLSGMWRICVALLLTVQFTIVAERAFAQMEDLPPRDVYVERGRSRGDKIALCFNPAAMLASFERDLAKAIASRLLLTPTIIEVKTWHPTEPLDYRLPLGFDELYIEFAERCDGFMGITLAQGYPSWLVTTRPYLSTRTVLAAIAPEYRKLQDVPVAAALGTRILGAVDNQLILCLQSLPEKSRWRRAPYFNNKLLMDHLFDRSVAAAFVWEPALYRATNGAPESAGLHFIVPPFELTETEFGIGLRSNDSFLSVSLGQAIDSLKEDGTIASLMIEHGLAAKPKDAAKK